MDGCKLLICPWIGSGLHRPWSGPVLATVGWRKNRLLRPAGHPCSWLSQRPTPGSHFAGGQPWACFAGCDVSVGNWYVCVHVCKSKHQNVWGVFQENSKEQIAKIRLYVYFFLSFLLCTCVMSILERFGFSYPNCSFLQRRGYNSAPIILSNK